MAGGWNKFSYEQVKEIFENENCVLLSKEYINARTKLDYVCSCGNKATVLLTHFRNGTRCKECQYSKLHNKFKLEYEEIKAEFEKEGCTLISKEYKNHMSPLEYICSCGNKSTITYNNFKKGAKCQNCAWDKRLETMYENGNAPSSSQQIYIKDSIGGELNYPVGRCMLDIAFVDEKIYVEYDGGGHWLSVALGVITEDEFVAKERRRSIFLISNGWKEIRIISKKDYLPQEDVLSYVVQQCKDYLNKGHSWIKVDIDNSIVITNKKVYPVNLGKLIKLERK